ncbi:MAG: VPLPA-CTERM sorting domain-containing protein [Steroidobacteraceae bacterium]
MRNSMLRLILRLGIDIDVAHAQRNTSAARAHVVRITYRETLVGTIKSIAMTSALLAFLAASAVAQADTIYTYNSNLDPFGSQSSPNPITFAFSMNGSLAANTNYFACYGESCGSVPTGDTYLPFPQISFTNGGTLYPASSGQISGNQITGAGNPQTWGTYEQFVQYQYFFPSTSQQLADTQSVELNLTTNSSGAISSWSVGASSNNGYYGGVYSHYYFNSTSGSSDNYGAVGYSNYEEANPYTLLNDTTNTTGTWTESTGPAISAVPLPAAAWLMLGGLGGFATFARKKRAA